MGAERALGNVPTDVSARKVGYDIVSFDPVTRALRFIEVKGRVAGADTVMTHPAGDHHVATRAGEVYPCRGGGHRRGRRRAALRPRRSRCARAAFRPGCDPVQPEAAAGACGGAGVKGGGNSVRRGAARTLVLASRQQWSLSNGAQACWEQRREPGHWCSVRADSFRLRGNDGAGAIAVIPAEAGIHRLSPTAHASAPDAPNVGVRAVIPAEAGIH